MSSSHFALCLLLPGGKTARYSFNLSARYGSEALRGRPSIEICIILFFLFRSICKIDILKPPKFVCLSVHAWQVPPPGPRGSVTRQHGLLLSSFAWQQRHTTGVAELRDAQTAPHPPPHPPRISFHDTAVTQQGVTAGVCRRPLEARECSGALAARGAGRSGQRLPCRAVLLLLPLRGTILSLDARVTWSGSAHRQASKTQQHRERLAVPSAARRSEVSSRLLENSRIKERPSDLSLERRSEPTPKQRTTTKTLPAISRRGQRSLID
jgi:hypothetical protein